MPAGRAENNLCAPVPALSRSHPRSLFGYSIVESLITSVNQWCAQGSGGIFSGRGCGTCFAHKLKQNLLDIVGRGTASGNGKSMNSGRWNLVAQDNGLGQDLDGPRRFDWNLSWRFTCW